jgi:hypothetical protein
MMNGKMNLNEKLEEIDEILASFEDWMHCEDGKRCTDARVLLKEVVDEFSLQTDEGLKTQYENVCNEYVRRFCEKQEIDFDGWIGDEVGGIASFISQYFFTIDDIALDLHTKQPKGLILDWQSDGVDYNMFNETPQNINYKSYTMGLRYEDLKK